MELVHLKNISISSGYIGETKNRDFFNKLVSNSTELKNFFSNVIFISLPSDLIRIIPEESYYLTLRKQTLSTSISG